MTDEKKEKTPLEEHIESLGHRFATREEALEILERTRERNQPVLDWLKDK